MADLQWQTAGVARPLVQIASISAADTWSDTIIPKPYEFLNVSVRGTWVGFVTLQRQLLGEATWGDYLTHDEPWEASFLQTETGTKYRVGFKAGEYTSGTAELRMSWG